MLSLISFAYLQTVKRHFYSFMEFYVIHLKNKGVKIWWYSKTPVSRTRITQTPLLTWTKSHFPWIWPHFSVILRLQYTFGSAIFFKFGFLGQNSGQRIISNFWKKFLKKAKYWRRNGGFTFSPEVKVYLLIDSPMARMQSTETIFAGITYMDVTNWLLSWSALLFWLPSIFGIRRVSIKL